MGFYHRLRRGSPHSQGSAPPSTAPRSTGSFGRQFPRYPALFGDEMAGKNWPRYPSVPFPPRFHFRPLKTTPLPTLWMVLCSKRLPIHAPAPSKAKWQLKDEFLKQLVGLIYFSLSLSILSRTFFPHDFFLASSWLISQSMLSTQILNDLQKIRFKTSFVSRSPWYSPIYSQGPTH